MEIRPIRPEEFAEAGRITALAYREFATPGDPEWEGYLAEIAHVAGRIDRTEVLVAVEDGRILGTATVELRGTIGDDDKELPPGTASLRMLGVDPAARGRGVGRALVRACIELVRATGKDTFMLRTVPQMEAAQALYRSMGFTRAEDLDLQFPNGFVLLGFRLGLG